MIQLIHSVPLPVSKKHIISIVNRMFRIVRCRKKELSIFFCTNTRIRKFNQRFLRRRRSTDVIAFVDNPRLPGFQKDYLGDIVISIDQARTQAKKYGHSVKKELTLLIIHGILHLMGYDDTTPRRTQKMFDKQEKIFKKLLRK